MNYNLSAGVCEQAQWVASPNYDDRDEGVEVTSLIVHCISLPPGEYGGGYIQRFFQNDLKADEHPYFKSMAHLTVSSHFLIDRLGQLYQFVNTDKRAWHAGESVSNELPKVNNYSIGIELEGWDEDSDGYTEQQYQCLASLYLELSKQYPKLDVRRIFAHSDIAPDRKPDPGQYFNWEVLLKMIDDMSI